MEILVYGVLALLVFWMIFSGARRQKAQMQAARTMQENLRPGDQIMTRAGLYGKVDSVDLEERKARIKIAKKTVVTISLDAVATVVEAAADVAPADTDKTAQEDYEK